MARPACCGDATSALKILQAISSPDRRRAYFPQNSWYRFPRKLRQTATSYILSYVGTVNTLLQFINLYFQVYFLKGQQALVLHHLGNIPLYYQYLLSAPKCQPNKQ